MRNTSKVRIGDQFDRLKVVKFLGSHKVSEYMGKYPLFLCRCLCGNELNVFSRNLTRGHTKSCGCLAKEILSKGQAKIREYNLSRQVYLHKYIYNYYKANAKRRGFVFNLDFHVFRSLIEERCHYCNSQPISRFSRDSRSILYNGLDRTNNSLGYEIGNIVPCCKVCNKIKGTLSKEQFLKAIKNIYLNNLIYSDLNLSSHQEIISWRENLKKENLKLVVASGCFDIFHIAHLDYLTEAKKVGDVLLVGINSDRSVRCLKGEDRPINNQKDRKNILSSCKCVDYTYIYDETIDFLKLFKPDIWIKGGDYSYDSLNMEEVSVVEENEGRILISPKKYDISTTSILNKIKK